jgi:hypothetical protein
MHSIAKIYYSNKIKEDEVGGAYTGYDRDQKVATLQPENLRGTSHLRKSGTNE